MNDICGERGEDVCVEASQPRCESDWAKKCEGIPSATTAVWGHEKARSVSIKQVDFGYIVEVGCQTFAVQELSTVLNMLTEYLYHPGEVEDKWRKGELNVK